LLAHCIAPGQGWKRSWQQHCGKNIHNVHVLPMPAVILLLYVRRWALNWCRVYAKTIDAQIKENLSS
jgi:hypothetical protein